MKTSLYLLIGLTLAVLPACGDQGSTGKAKAPAPAVVVTPVISKPVAASSEFVGQTEAFQSVDLRARVTGFLLAQGFKEGKQVKRNEVLFVIDPSEYDAKRDVSAAKVERAKATLE